ncbi:Alpha/Beta hydrolase protein [Cubamyces lactineus]|nr:Alpha/Beta hydrolase protein [Cubamyces lactineus]
MRCCAGKTTALISLLAGLSRVNLLQAFCYHIKTRQPACDRIGATHLVHAFAYRRPSCTARHRSPRWITTCGLAAGQAAEWGQCGGINYTGPTICVAGTTCVVLNDYFSQCLPNTSTTPPPTSVPTSPTSSNPTSTAPTGLSSIPASTLHQIANFGDNPNNIGMFVYKPARVASKPALITFGYVVLYPNSPHSGTCWDVSSDETLTHNGGSDSFGIVSAARYAIANWGVDPDRVFAVGTSSGAMMTSVLAGAYPDIFKAGIIDSGVAFGCFAVPGQPDDSWNSQCSEGQLILTGQEWARRVYDAYPGYTGNRPKMQVWHGTADTTLYPQNFFEEVKQWTTVLGYLSTPISNASEPYLPAGYSNATFGPMFQAILAQGVGHTMPLFEQQYLQFLGIA